MKKKAAILLSLTIAISIIQANEGTYGKNISKNYRQNISSNNSYVPVLMYHNLTAKLINDDHGATMAVSTFKSQMEYLKKVGYNTITFSQLEQYMAGKIKLPQKPIIITFDDGYESNYKYAYPILKNLKMKANIDMVAGVIGKKCKTFSYLTGNEIKEMAKSGVIEIGSHTYNLHSKEHLERDIKHKENINNYRLRLVKDFSKSKEILKNYGVITDILSLPFGYKNPEIINAAKKAGFKVVLTTENGVVRKGRKLEDIPRIFIGPFYTPQRVVNKIISQASLY